MLSAAAMRMRAGRDAAARKPSGGFRRSAPGSSGALPPLPEQPSPKAAGGNAVTSAAASISWCHHLVDADSAHAVYAPFSSREKERLLPAALRARPALQISRGDGASASGLRWAERSCPSR